MTAEPGMQVELAPGWIAGGAPEPAGAEGAGRTVHVHLAPSPAALARRATAPVPPARTVDATLDARGEEWADGSVWEVGDDAAGGQLRLDAGRDPAVVAWDSAGDWSTGEAAGALHLLTVEALRACGLVTLHAAVVARDGDAVALLGRSGAGKSTTLLRAVRAGWLPLCEDLAWVDPATLDMAGGDRGVRMWPEARDRYAPWLAGLPWEPEPDGKVLLRYDALRAEPPASARLARVALLHRPDEAGGAAADAPTVREAARALWEAAGLPLVPAHQRSLSGAVAAIARGVAAEWLPLGAIPGAGLPRS